MLQWYILCSCGILHILVALNFYQHLTRDSHLKLQNSQERAIYDALKSKEFSHTPLFNELILQETVKETDCGEKPLYSVHQELAATVPGSRCCAGRTDLH
jgi:hypothetical protein